MSIVTIGIDLAMNAFAAHARHQHVQDHAVDVVAPQQRQRPSRG